MKTATILFGIVAVLYGLATLWYGGFSEAVLIAEQNKLGKERQEWALHTSEVIRSLNQQLAEALEQNLVLSKQTDHTILDLSNYVDSLEQQLAGAIAACKQKDESIEAAHNGLRWWMDAFPLHVTEADNEEMLKIVKALAIQSDDSALKDEWRFK